MANLEENHIAENLYMTIINDGAGTICGLSYRLRCDMAAADTLDPAHSTTLFQRTRDWLELATRAEGWLHRHHPETDRATARDMLAAALAVADYYHSHVVEAAKSMEAANGT